MSKQGGSRRLSSGGGARVGHDEGTVVGRRCTADRFGRPRPRAPAQEFDGAAVKSEKRVGGGCEPELTAPQVWLWLKEMTRALLAVAIAPAPAVGVRMPPGVGPSVRRAPPRSMAVAAPPN